MSQLIYSSIFGELTRNVQVRIDAASELNKRIFDQTIYSKYLDWDIPTVGLDFEELMGQYNITIAAATIGDNSKEPILGTYGVETVKEKVLNHALTLPMTITEYRKILQLLDSKSISDAVQKQQLINLMWGGTERVVKAVQAKLDIIFLGALSNEGKFEFNETNNPEGGVRGMINYNQPSENIASSKIQWTEANLANVDCFEDIQAMIDASQDKTVLAKALLSPALISYMCRSKKMKQMIWGTDKSSRTVQLKEINEYMSSNSFPLFEKIQRQCMIQKGKSLVPYNPFNNKNIVFIPDGKLGIIKNAWSNNELKPENGVAYSNYDRIRVSQWGVGETQGSNGVEFTKAESLSLPVVTEIGGVYTLKTSV